MYRFDDASNFGRTVGALPARWYTTGINALARGSDEFSSGASAYTAAATIHGCFEIVDAVTLHKTGS